MTFGNGSGGGISNSGGIVDVRDSTINGNSSIGNGGGISNSGGIVDVRDSTINGNSTIGNGGGISNSGTMTVSNSTISGNSSVVGSANGFIIGGNGGGINNSGTVALLFSTLTLNQAANGGGVYNNTNGSTSARNTIIAANLLSTDGINPDVSGTFTSFGYNLIGDSTGSTGFDATGDIVGTSDNPIDPRLAPLDFNGGPTQTIALLPDSPAIDAADPTVLDTDPTTDQRGLPRVSNGRADIGAFEVQV